MWAVGQVHAGYDDVGDKCLGVKQPGTVNLAHVVIDIWGGYSLGIYNCRLPSLHSEGRAYDHAWTNAHSGFEIANRLVDHHAELGIQEVIWWKKIWTYKHANAGWRNYHGDSEHKDHIHMAQNWSGAHYLTYAAALNTLAPIQHPPPPPEEDDMVIFYSEDDNDPVEVVETGSAIFIIPTGQDSAALHAAGAKKVAVSVALFSEIKSQAIG